MLNSHLSLLSESQKLLYAWIPKEVDPEKLISDLVDMNAHDCFFSVSLSGANIFFKAAIKGYDKGGFHFFMPEKIFKVQRRRDVRLSIPDGYVLKASFQDPLFPETHLNKKVIDISAGGLAFQATEFEEGLFHVGLILDKFQFTIKGREVVLQAEVRHIQKMPETSKHKGLKVGVMFKNMKPGDAQHVAQYVFEESRKYLSKFL